MSRPDRRNAVIVALIGAFALIAAAYINSLKKTPANPPAQTTIVEQPKTENRAETKGSQSPAVVGSKDVTVTYGEDPAKKKAEKTK
jgi:hypothetical protein